MEISNQCWSSPQIHLPNPPVIPDHRPSGAASDRQHHAAVARPRDPHHVSLSHHQTTGEGWGNSRYPGHGQCCVWLNMFTSNIFTYCVLCSIKISYSFDPCLLDLSLVYVLLTDPKCSQRSSGAAATPDSQPEKVQWFNGKLSNVRCPKPLKNKFEFFTTYTSRKDVDLGTWLQWSKSLISTFVSNSC